MRPQYSRIVALVAPALLVLGCTTDTEKLTAPPRASLLAPTGPSAPSASDIVAQITALFPPPGLRTAALAQFRNIARSLAAGRTADAQAQMFDLVAFTVEKFGQGRLLNPNPPSTRDAVLNLINALYAFVGLAPPIPPTALGQDGAAAVIGAGGGDLLPARKLAGLRVPAGAVSSDHLFVIARRDDLAQAGTCLSTLLTQYPLCYDFAVFPQTTFAVNVTVVVCQLEPPPPPDIDGRLVLAHPGPSGQILLTTRAADPFGIVCTDAVLSGGGLGGLLKQIGALAGRLIGPARAYASHVGLGGLTGSFSPFLAVDPLSAVGVCQNGQLGAQLGILGILATYQNFTDALANVPPGQRIEVCGGTFTAENVAVTKPVTIEAAFPTMPLPVIQDNPANTNAVDFLISDIARGKVTFRNLSFVNTGVGATGVATTPTGTATTATYDQVVVDHCMFSNAPGGSAGVFGGSSTVPTSLVLVKNSMFTGGGVGVFASGDVVPNTIQPDLSTAPRFDVQNSTFSNFTFGGIQYQIGSSGLIKGNSVSGCGPHGCIRAPLNNQLVIDNNTVTVTFDPNIPFGSGVQFGIAADAVPSGVIRITSNQVMGQVGGADPTDPASYAIQQFGIRVGRVVAGLQGKAATATVSNNYVTGAVTGLSAVDGTITGTDNVITGVLVGISGRAVTVPTTVSITKSDLTSYTQAILGLPPAPPLPITLNLTCNWWGFSSGPQGVGAGVLTSAFTPWAVGPIANGAGGSCTGTPMLQRLACSLEPTLHSIDGSVPTSIEFVNSTAGPVTVYWLNYSGGRVLYATLAAGAFYVQQTFLTHPWVVTDASNNCLGIWLPGGSLGVAVIGG